MSEQEAPWHRLEAHIATLHPPTFTLATTSPAPSSSPHCRTLIHRGFFASLPANPRNPAPLNPRVYETHLPTFTTDARMEKLSHLGLDTEAGDSGSGGGGKCEACYWIPEANTQWRLMCQAWVLGPDIESPGGKGPAVIAALKPYMRPVSSSSSDDKTDPAANWSWAREVTAHFGNLSPVMRGSFKNPMPGTPKSATPGSGLGLGQEVEDLEDEVAGRNFRVVVLVPEVVERLDLSDPKECRRWRWTKAEGVQEWRGEELWP